MSTNFHLRIIRRVAVLVWILAGLFPVIPLAVNAQTVINFNETAQRFEAWGTNTNVLTGHLAEMCYLRPEFCNQHYTPTLKAQYYDHLFDPAIGIGFNGVRAFAHPGQNPDILDTYKHDNGRWTARYFTVGTEAWMNQDGSWKSENPSKGMMELLAAAKERGADTFLLRAQSAPWWMTIARDSTGNSKDGPDKPNLDVANYRAYADYVVGVAKRLTQAGYPIRSISLFEESASPPSEDEETGEIRGGINDYLPVYYNGELRQPLLVKELDAAIKEQGVDARASAANEAAPRATLGNHLSLYPDNFRQYIGIVGTHGYTARPNEVGGFAPLRNFAESIGTSIEVTEDDWGGTPRDTGVGDTWPTQVRMAKKIVMQFDHLRMTRWFLWNPGRRLVWFDFDNKALEFHPQYYMLKFVAHAIPAGSTMLKNTTDDVAAALYRKGSTNELRVMAVNWSDSPKSHTLQFPNLGPNAAYTQALITEATMTSPVTTTGTLSSRTVTITLPPMSIASLVFDADNQGNINIVKDRVRDAIAKRITSLDAFLVKIEARKSARKLRGTTESISSVNGAKERLVALRERVRRASTVEELESILREVIGEERVYQLVISRARVLLSVDNLDANMAGVETRIPKLTNRTNRAEGKANDVSEARTLLAPLQADADFVQEKASTAYDLVINLVPDGGNTAIKRQNEDALAQAREHLRAARERQTSIYEKIKRILALLKGWGV